MALTRQIAIQGHRAYVLDAEVPEDIVKKIYQELAHDRSYTRSEAARPDRIEIKHWATNLDIDEFTTSEIGKRTVELVEFYFPNEGQKPFRAYCNVATYGDMLSVHRDCALSNNDVTALWFICDEWERDWRGEFLLLDLDYDAQLAVTPRPGRLCIFRGLLPHVGTPPSRLCYKPRLTLVCKFSPSNDMESREQAGDRGAFRSVPEVFTHIARRIETMPRKNFSASYKFIVEGATEDVWFVELTESGGRVAPEDLDADLTITLNEETFLDVVNGKVNIMKAFFFKRIKAKGNLDLAIHLRDLLGISV